MDEQLTGLLDELHRYGVQHDAGKPNRLDRLRNLEPDTAALLAVLVRAMRPQTLLELGTSNGYSACGWRTLSALLAAAWSASKLILSAAPRRCVISTAPACAQWPICVFRMRRTR